MNNPATWLLTATLVTLSGAASADSMRCGKNLVSDGDSPFEVLEACGEPKMKQQVSYQAPKSDRYRNEDGDWATKETTQTLSAELWYYKPNSLQYSLRFEEGKLVSVTSD